MSTSAPETLADVHADALSTQRWAALEAFASKRGLSLDTALRRALDLSGLILDALDEPDTHIYLYRKSRRYSLIVDPLPESE